jgi:hypothetical protein
MYSCHASKWFRGRRDQQGKKKLIYNPERRVYFFIAEKLGKTVKEVLSQMTSSEITEWIAYFSLKIEGDPSNARTELSKIFSSRIKKKGR